jgi:hypothetical protein
MSSNQQEAGVWGARVICLRDNEVCVTQGHHVCCLSYSSLRSGDTAFFFSSEQQALGARVPGRKATDQRSLKLSFKPL